MRVAEKVGMKFEGIAKKEVFKNGKYIDCAIYSKIKN
jgi:RimJ/RimL family protein N-acetyltransferase